jgi:hypothetical protein
VHWGTVRVKVGSGKRAKTMAEPALEIQFSAPVSGAGNLGAYQLSSITTRKVGKHTVTNYKPIRLASAVPASSPTTSMVSLVPATKPNVAQSDRLTIIAAGLTDIYGRPIEGDETNGNYVAIVTKNGAAPAAVAPATRMARAVDAAVHAAGIKGMIMKRDPFARAETRHRISR